MIVENDNDLTGKIKDIRILNGNRNTLYGEINSNIDKTYHAKIKMSEISKLEQKSNNQKNR